MDVAGGPISEAEIVSHDNRSRRTFTNDELLHELLCGELGSFRSEGEHFDVFDPFRVNQFLTLLERGQQPGRALRRNDSRGMRIERQERGHEIMFAREIEHAVNQPLVPKVDTVEVTDRECGVHAIYKWTSSSSPS